MEKSKKMIESLAKDKGCKRLQFLSNNSMPMYKFYSEIGYKSTERGIYVKYF